MVLERKYVSQTEITTSRRKAKLKVKDEDTKVSGGDKQGQREIGNSIKSTKAIKSLFTILMH